MTTDKTTTANPTTGAGGADPYAEFGTTGHWVDGEEFDPVSGEMLKVRRIVHPTNGARRAREHAAFYVLRQSGLLELATKGLGAPALLIALEAARVFKVTGGPLKLTAAEAARWGAGGRRARRTAALQLGACGLFEVDQSGGKAITVKPAAETMAMLWRERGP